MKELKLELARDYGFEAERVWSVLGEFGNIAWAAPGIKVEQIGEGPGMIRRLHMPDMEPIDEVLETLDHDARRFSYTIPRGLPMPITDYRAAVGVEALGPGRSRVHWTATGAATGDFTGDQAAEILRGAYTQMLDALEGHLSTN